MTRSSPETSQPAKTINRPCVQLSDVDQPKFHRQVSLLPYELREHCMIYFEEGLYCQALNLLISLLTVGSAASTQPPVILPPPQHIALIATLAVHPTLTTRAKSVDQILASNLALRYLQLLLKHVGPLQGILNDAFAFTSSGASSRRGGSTRKRITEEGVSPVDDVSSLINNELANAGSLWVRAEDFWQVVGWCFNCSVIHQRRWERWSVWLSYMIDMLEADWELRQQMVENDAQGKSLVVKYIDSGRATSGRERKIVRAIFADGRVKSSAEFGEIWKNETKELKKDADVQKAERKIDIDADDYGDYMEDEADADLEDSGSDRSSPARGTDHHHANFTPNPAASLGGMDSIDLRVRLLSLLSKVSASYPGGFVGLNTLYDIFLDHIRCLPLPAFFMIMSPSSLRPFVAAAASTLTQYVLRSLIAAAAPTPSSDALSQAILQTNYLPFPANTNSIVDNTKVSLCVETLLRLLHTHPKIGLSWTPELHEAAEAGIEARAKRAKKKQTKKNSDACDGAWLAASAERIRAVVAMAKL